MQKAAYYSDAHFIWYYFAGIGIISAISLLIFRIVTKKIDVN